MTESESQVKCIWGLFAGKKCGVSGQVFCLDSPQCLHFCPPSGASHKRIRVNDGVDQLGIPRMSKMVRPQSWEGIVDETTHQPSGMLADVQWMSSRRGYDFRVGTRRFGLKYHECMSWEKLPRGQAWHMDAWMNSDDAGVRGQRPIIEDVERRHSGCTMWEKALLSRFRTASSVGSRAERD